MSKFASTSFISFRQVAAILLQSKNSSDEVIKVIGFLLINISYMSEHPGPQQGDSLGLQKYLDSTKKILSSVRSFDYKKFSQDVITFTSIIGTSFIIQLLIL